MTHYDLLVVGTGSGNDLPEDDLVGWRVAMVEQGPWGGTCLNRGCIPSKMFVHAADVALAARDSDVFGVDLRLHGVDWPAIRDRVFGRIDPIAAGGEEYRRSLDWVDVHKGTGRFVGTKRMQVALADGGTVEITADRVVLAAGSRPHVPAIAGIDDVRVHTSDDIMRLDELPRRMVVLGGGYVACEMSHVFDALGTEVTLVIRGTQLLGSEDDDVARRATAAYGERLRLVTGARDPRVRRADDGTITFSVTLPDATSVDLDCDVLLVATGRTPNSDLLDVAATGVATDEHGHVRHDPQRRTNVEGVWTLGDMSSHWPLKHLANAEARAVFHNLTRPPGTPDDELVVPVLAPEPRAMFGSPQVGAAGASEQDLVAAGIPYRVGRRAYGGVAYGWALEDTTSFCKVLVHAEHDTILGVHVVGPEAANLTQLVVAAMASGTTATQLARDTIWIHPALAEVVENALLDAIA